MKLPEIEREHGFMGLAILACITACAGHEWLAWAFFILALLVVGAS